MDKSSHRVDLASKMLLHFKGLFYINTYPSGLSFIMQTGLRYPTFVAVELDIFIMIGWMYATDQCHNMHTRRRGVQDPFTRRISAQWSPRSHYGLFLKLNIEGYGRAKSTQLVQYILIHMSAHKYTLNKSSQKSFFLRLTYLSK